MYGCFDFMHMLLSRCCEVYDGQDTATGDHVALKVFRRYQDYRGALKRELLFLQVLAAPEAHVGKLSKVLKLFYCE